MALVKPGIRPITDGPSKIPPNTSPTTRGWRRYPRGKWSARHTMRITAAWIMNIVIYRCAILAHFRKMVVNIVHLPDWRDCRLTGFLH